MQLLYIVYCKYRIYMCSYYTLGTVNIGLHMKLLYIVYCKLIAVHDIVYIAVIQDTHFNMNSLLHSFHACSVLVQYSRIYSTTQFRVWLSWRQRTSFLFVQYPNEKPYSEYCIGNPIIQSHAQRSHLYKLSAGGHCGCIGSPISQVYKDTHILTPAYLCMN